MPDPRLARFRAPALAFAAYLLVIAGSAAVLFAAKIGARPDHVRAFYLGSEATFAAPKTAAGLLEVAVPHLLAVPLVLFAAAHVVGFARAIGRTLQALLVALSFGSALAGIAAGFLVRFVAPGLAWMKLGAFAGLEGALLAWAVLLAAVFAPRPERAPSPAARAAEEVAP